MLRTASRVPRASGGLVLSMIRNPETALWTRTVPWRPAVRSQAAPNLETSLSRRPFTASTGPRLQSRDVISRRIQGHGSRRGFRFSSRRRATTPPGHEGGGGAPRGKPEQEPQSLSARLRKLSREYGWTAVGVYMALSVLDFPFCLLLVRVVGTEKIGQLENFLTSNVKKMIPESVQQFWVEYKAALRKAEIERTGDDDISDAVDMMGWGVEEAKEANKADASLGTQLALAYAIHKSFIFLRVPLAAAVLPKVVKVLRSWGWQIGKRSRKV